MQTEALLREISEFSRRSGMAETTFGRLAVNDGKFVSRLKGGGRLTKATVDRVRAFMAQSEADAALPETSRGSTARWLAGAARRSQAGRPNRISASMITGKNI